jgi:thiol-disulfide isomerase/thioredoxin
VKNLVGALLLVAVPLLALSCAAPPREAKPAVAKTAVGNLLAPRRGKVFLLLLGRDGCPGTVKTTPMLDALVKARPGKVQALRLDVPLPAESGYRASSEWKCSYPREVDTERRVASELEFFFYPTLYVFDRDGELRFTGGCEPGPFGKMLDEILAEKPGAKKKVYTLPLVAEGHTGPEVSGKLLGGGAASLKRLGGSKATLLFFSDTTCPFTVKELPNLAKIAAAGREKGVNVVIVDRGSDAAAIRPVYAKGAPGIPVVLDADRKVFRAYGVDAVPFHYLLAADGKVVSRRPFTAGAAGESVASLLGTGGKTFRFEPAAAG